MGIDTLQQSLAEDVNGITTGIQEQIAKMILWIVIPLIILAILMLLLYILRLMRHRKVENAIFEIRDTLREMKLTQTLPASPAPNPQPPVDDAARPQ